MRFIRDIIDEKKSEALPNAPKDFEAGRTDEVVNQGSVVDALNPLPQGTSPMPSTTVASHPSDEQALRNIFKTAAAEAPTTVIDAADASVQDEGPELDHPHEPIGTVAHPEEIAPEEFGGPEKDQADIHQTANVTPVAPTAPSETHMEPQPAALAGTEAASQPVEVPQPAAGRMLGRSGRVKTRVLGFGQPQHTQTNVFNRTEAQAASKTTTHPVGWLVVVKGPGTGSAFTIFSGVSSIGRGLDQTVALAFGDNSISRENHAAVAYDSEQRSFFLGHGGKTNLVRLNDRPVLSTEELKSEDEVRIGETTLRFIALCGEKFSWSTDPSNGVTHDTAQ